MAKVRIVRPTAKQYAVAAALKDGCSARKACLKAGYSKATVNCKATKIARSEHVKQALLELGVFPGDLGKIAKVGLQEQLLNPPESARDRISTIRLGLEADDVIGKKEHLHLHTFPPSVVAILERQLAKLRQLPAAQAPEAGARAGSDEVDVQPATVGLSANSPQ